MIHLSAYRFPSPYTLPVTSLIMKTMRAVTVLFAGELAPESFEPFAEGKSAIERAVEGAQRFPGTEKLILLGIENIDYPVSESEKVKILRKPVWTKKDLLETLSRLISGEGSDSGFDLCYFAWADCPFLDPALAGAIAERHVRYAAEYSYADGWPYGFAPELLAPGTAGILLKILGNNDGNVERNTLFDVLQKDINAFDIETEISPVDLRFHRLCFAADSKRNLLLVKRFFETGLTCASDAADLIEKQPGLLRTLPAFFNIQVSGACPQACSICPWPQFGKKEETAVTESKDFMKPDQFETLLEKIIAFAGDAVISLSLWGELALHPQKMELIKAVLSRPELSLIIETSGIGWKTEEIEQISNTLQTIPKRKNSLLPSPLSWIISLDAQSASRYEEVRGPGFAEAVECAKKLLNAFPHNAYVQAVRIKDYEDDIEQFYRFWKNIEIPALKGNKENHVIIQKYDNFCGALPKLQASDLSPVKRSPCKHSMRDMVILLDGSVPLCKEDLSALKVQYNLLGNVFAETLDEIWKHGEALYLEQAEKKYSSICVDCDEYYTYNF